MRFETEEDRKREEKAIKLFVNVFSGKYKKLDPNDIDYKVFDEANNPIAYVEVKGRRGSIRASYPLSISVRKLSKLVSKRLNPVIIWACEDGIIYGKAQELVGTVRFGGRNVIRDGAVRDQELMVYYEKQPELKYIRYSES
jgi:hypothetical protein